MDAGLDLHLSNDEYEKKISKLQERLHQLVWAMYHQKKNAVLVFEGWDAAGKGSAIRRVTAAIDARLYRVIPIAAPSDEEKAILLRRALHLILHFLPTSRLLQRRM